MSIEARAWLGRTLDGRYRLDAILGAGGLGTVYRATQLRLDRPVAVKMLHPELLQSAELQRRFDREVETLSRLAHPHIVTLTDSGVLEGGVGYLVMELLEGQSLEERLRFGRGLAPVEAIEIARQMLLGLAEAHGKNVLHRDIKPANVFLVPLAEGVHVKLLDFGLAKVRSRVAEEPGAFPTLTADGVVVGTPTYMAPEQGTGQPVTAASDVYSVGNVLFEMLTGHAPFRRDDKVESIRAHLADPVPELTAMCPTLRPTEPLRALVHRALEKDHAKRFESAMQMLRAIDALPRPAAQRDDVPAPPPLPVRAKGPSPSGTESTIELRSGELTDATVSASAAVVRSSELQEVAPTPPRTARRWGLTAVLALAVAAVVSIGLGAGWLWLSGGTSAAEGDDGALPPSPSAEDGAPVADAEAEDEEVVEAADLEPPPDEGVANPFARDAIPDELRVARRAILRGRWLSDRQERDVERYARSHRRDARAPLLLARSARYTSRWRDMVRHYVSAQRIDETSMAFTPMLADLVRAVKTDEAGRAAADAVADIYGQRALATVRARATELPEGEARTRQLALAERLAGL